MNFFEAQEQARRRTGWLVVLFGLAVMALIVLTYLLVMVLMFSSQGGDEAGAISASQGYLHWDVFAGVAVVIIALVSLGSLYKTMSLSSGGARVAEMLGGRLLSRDTDSFEERRLLNVVEEMAIAAGMPVPRVYLLDEPGINAFAAGLTSSDAVIGITRGALENLSREELQGVVAHEFSHIFNGDMRLNIRLVGILHGILLLGTMGYYLLRATRFMGRSRSSRDGGQVVVAMVALGAGLLVLGYTGYFFGQWIKAMVSRQREYLADASAVQFTRDKQGIANALKKIGGTKAGSLLQSPAAAEYSHAYFAQGVKGFLQSMFATHPPLPTRIKRIEPGWGGEFIQPKPKPKPPPETKKEKPTDARHPVLDTLGAHVVTGVALAGAQAMQQAVERIGTVSTGQLEAARELIDGIPTSLRDAAAEPYGARALIYALLMDPDTQIAAKQQAVLEELADPAVATLHIRLMAPLQQLASEARLPLLELAMPSLQTLSREQYQRFRRVVQALITADNKVSLDEWLLQRLVLTPLDVNFALRKPAKAVHGDLHAVRGALQVMLSLVAHTEYRGDEAQAQRAFAAGAAEAGEEALNLLARQALNIQRLNNAMDSLEQLKPLVKPAFLKACTATLMHDGKTTVPAHELLRGIASCLDSPMPLLELFAPALNNVPGVGSK